MPLLLYHRLVSLVKQFIGLVKIDAALLYCDAGADAQRMEYLWLVISRVFTH
jgi:hypothetical protein